MEIPAIELVNYSRFHETSRAAIELAGAVLGTRAIFLVYDGPGGMTALNDVDAAGLQLSQGQAIDPGSNFAMAIRQAADRGELETLPLAGLKTDCGGGLVNCPIRLSDGRLFGFIGSFSTKPAAISESQNELVASIARLLGAAIDAELGSSHDKLTGLYSRRMFDDHLNLEIARSRRNGVRLAVLVVGFTVPDESPIQSDIWWLPRIAERLRASVREGDTISRVGACEFALLVPDLRDNESAGRVASALVDALRDPFDVQQEPESIVPAVGVALCPLDGFNPVELVRRACIAMAAARTLGTGEYRLFSHDRGLQLVSHSASQSG
jgi:diguanylate cyclase (GGDEF)-like protein